MGARMKGRKNERKERRKKEGEKRGERVEKRKEKERENFGKEFRLSSQKVVARGSFVTFAWKREKKKAKKHRALQ